MSDDQKPVPEENVPTPEPEAPKPLPEDVPPGLGRFVDFLRSHPRLKAPSIVTIVAWIVLLVGGGILHLSDAHTSAKIDKSSKEGIAALQRIHNAEACTLRIVVGGIRDRSVKTSKDMTQTASARQRAKDSLPELKFILDGQVTSPPNVNCQVLLKKIAQEARAKNPIGKAG